MEVAAVFLGRVIGACFALLVIQVSVAPPARALEAALEDSAFVEGGWRPPPWTIGNTSFLYTGFSDIIKYNRVEGLALGGGIIFRNLPGRVNLLGRISYGFADDRWKYALDGVRPVDPKRSFFIGGRCYRAARFSESPQIVTTFIQSYSSFLYGTAYRDYFFSSGWDGYLIWRYGECSRFEIGIRKDQQKSVDTRASFSVFSRRESLPPNPPVINGAMGGGYLKWTLSNRPSAWVLRRTNSWSFDGEIIHAQPDFLGGSFDYTQAMLVLTRYQATTELGWIVIQAKAGESWRKLPPQDMFDLGGGIPFYRPFGILRGAAFKQYNGSRFWAVMVDHHFEGEYAKYLPLPKTALFQSLEFVLFGEVGRTGFSSIAEATARAFEPIKSSQGIYRACGISLQDRFGFFRVDFGYYWKPNIKKALWAAFSVNY